MDSSRSNLLEALKQVERRTESSASGWRLLIYLVVLVPPLLVLMQLHFGHLGEWQTTAASPVAIVLLPLGSLVLLATSIGFAISTRRSTRKSLDASNIAPQIASGELMHDRIVELTPWPWRRNLPGYSAATPTVQEVVNRVAWNLDWYLRSPRRLWRWNWIFLPLVIVGIVVQVVIVGLLLAVATLGYGPLNETLLFALEVLARTVLGKDTYLIMSLAPASLVGIAFLYMRRQIWTEELVRHLRERLLA